MGDEVTRLQRDGIARLAGGQTLATIDLGSLEDAKGQTKALVKLSSLVRRFQGLSSARNDLIACHATLRTLGDLDSGYPDEHVVEQSEADAFTGAALAAHAIVLYTRATETGSNRRAQLPVKKWMTQEQYKAHRHFMVLRNEGMAHFGVAKGLAYGHWYNETTVAVIKDDNSLVIEFVPSRVNYLSADITKLSELTLLVLENLEPLIEPATKAVAQAFVDIDQGLLQKIVANHAFNPASFFFNEMDADMWLTGRSGYVRQRRIGKGAELD